VIWLVSGLGTFPLEGMMASDRVKQARQKARILYEGKRVPHYSCGICIAATFGLPTRPFQALRKGGVTGEGECGAIVAGRLVLGYFLGDPEPTGALRPELLQAMEHYERLWKARTEPGQALTSGAHSDIICNTLVGHLEDDFWGEERMGHCTRLSAELAACVAETLEEFGVEFEIEPIPDLKSEENA
jgi:hypothetical protein